MLKSCCLLVLILTWHKPLMAQEKKKTTPLIPNRNRPEPTHANVRYGSHERNVLDFWQTPLSKDQPAPLALYIHGGGFVNGDKRSLNDNTLNELLRSGVSVAAVNYRLIQHAPLPAAHEDCVQALQFLRSKHKEWNIDKTRVGGFGGSAGAQLVMFLAFHDDQADPKNTDPLKRESTRLCCVATNGGQITMDLNWWSKHIPQASNPTHNIRNMFGASSDDELAGKVNAVAALKLISKDDPPIFMSYSMPPDAAVPEDKLAARNWMVHHVNHGLEMKKLCDALGVEAYLMYPGARSKYRTVASFLTDKLTGKTP